MSAPHENRRLKVVGLVLIGVASPALLFLQNQTESPTWLDQDGWYLALLAAIYLVAANLFVLGLILVVSGFKDAPLSTDARARRGLLMKLAGANPLIVVAGGVMIGDSGPWRDWDVLLIPVLVALVVLSRLGIGLLRKGWKYDAIQAKRLLEEDRRPPVVYLRSFKDDEKIILGSGFRRWMQYWVGYLTAVTLEQELAIIMNRVGPVVAIGRPGELLPELGAARLYASDDEWRATVTDLMRRARFVIVRAGSTENLQWEIAQVVNLVPRQNVIFIAWYGDSATFDHDIEQRFGPLQRNPDPQYGLLWWLSKVMRPSKTATGKIVCFDRDAKPCVEPIQFGISWQGFLTIAVRPYRDPLRAAFRRVFGRLGVCWIERKSRSTAILLAFFVGMFGCHHFYLGDRRRGLRYAAFWWTTVPLFLAWLDGIRLVMMDEQTFERAFGRAA